METSLAGNCLRPLGPSEQYFWLSNQNSAKHFVIAAEVVGDATVEAWVSALAAAQLRHPLLRVSVEYSPDGPPCFREHANIPIPLRIVPEEEFAVWHVEMAKELATPIPLSGPNKTQICRSIIHWIFKLLCAKLQKEIRQAVQGIGIVTTRNGDAELLEHCIDMSMTGSALFIVLTAMLEVLLAPFRCIVRPGEHLKCGIVPYRCDDTAGDHGRPGLSAHQQRNAPAERYIDQHEIDTALGDDPAQTAGLIGDSISEHVLLHNSSLVRWEMQLSAVQGSARLASHGKVGGVEHNIKPVPAQVLGNNEHRIRMSRERSNRYDYPAHRFLSPHLEQDHGKAS
jgi:hypothetical protein